MATPTRQLRRCQEELDAAITFAASVEDLDVKYRELEAGHKDLEDQHRRALRELEDERLQRVFAQRGLVNYMHEHGLADRIGYDPDQDPKIQQEIAEGRIPARGVPLKEIMGLRVTAPALPGMPLAANRRPVKPESGRTQAGGLPDPTAPLAGDSTPAGTLS